MKQLFTEKLHRTTWRHTHYTNVPTFFVIIYLFFVPKHCTAPVHSVHHSNDKVRASCTIMNTHNQIEQFAQNLTYMTENENITAS